MSVLTIRAHRRYALRMPSKLKLENRKAVPCLLIELSQQGARISNLGQRELAVGESVALNTSCGRRLDGTIRWAHDGVAGIALGKPLHLPDLAELIHANRKTAVA
ncbi:PilZ domain-containing protein [Erythrobacter alti]|uniref:PilZ domain-containing protein n=1 Tax=Erythrobacter alti TaxID=1896145 RepID=UPI0030F40F03